MLIQMYYYQTNPIKCTQANLPQSMQKVLENLHQKQEGWKRLFTLTRFGDSTNDLCNTFPEVTKKLCTAENLSSSLKAFLACCMIPLHENHGLRPMGVGQVLQ